ALTFDSTASGMPSSVYFDINSTGTDKIQIGTGNKINMNTGGAKLFITGNASPSSTPALYPLLGYDAGALQGTGTFSLGTASSGLFTYTLVFNNANPALSTELDLKVTGNPTPTTAYWRGSA